MAINLTAVFKMRDEGSSQIRKITQMMDKMNRTSKITGESMSRSQSAVSRLGNSTSSASSKLGGFATQVSSLRVGTNGLSASLKGAQSALLGIAGAYLTTAGLASGFGNFTQAADSYSNINARLANVNDGLQTQAQLQDKIFKASQRSRSSYDEMASSVAKLNLLAKGAFSSNDEAIKFTELMTKSFAVSGAGQQEMESGMYQLTQAMAAGKLQGDEFRSIMENAPLLAQAISNTAGVSMGALKEMSSEGTITADLIKRSLFNAADEIEEKFGNMPMTFSQAVTVFKSSAKRVFEPLFNQFIGFVNSKTFETLENKALSFVKLSANGLSKVFSAVKSLYGVWQTVGPVVTKVAKVIGTFALVAGSMLAVVGIVKLIGVALAFVASPIGLIAAGITGLIFGFKALYDNSESFRGAIDKVITVVKDLWSVFEKGGVEGLISVLFPPDVAKKINGVIDGIKSKVSDLMNAFKNGGVGGVFDEIFGDGSFESLKSKFEEVKTYITDKVTQFKPIFEQLVDAFSTAWDTVSDILTSAWDIIEPILSGLWDWIQIIGDIAMMVFDNVIAPAISFLAQLFSTLWAVAQPILMALSIAWEALSAVIKWVWDNVLAPLVDFILTGVKNAFDEFSGVLSTVQGWFETLTGWVKTAYDKVKEFIGYIGKVKPPSWITNGISAGVNFVGNLIGAGDGKKGGNPKSHYSGLDSVPYDGYTARLHKSEKILTAREARAYDEGKGGNGSGGVVISGNSFTIREEADIEKVAYQLAKLIEREATQVG